MEQLQANLSYADLLSDNSTNSTDSDVIPYYLRIETYVAPFLFSIIFIIGVLGNWTVCAIFIKHPNMRNVPNT